MGADSVRDRLRKELSGVVAVVVTGTWLALLMLGVPNGVWLAVMLFGYVALVPLAGILEASGEPSSAVDHDGAQTEQSAPAASALDGDEDALTRLRRRYAEGELTDEQFERKLEQLLTTETIEDVERQFEDDSTRGTDTERSELTSEFE